MVEFVTIYSKDDIRFTMKEKRKSRYYSKQKETPAGFGGWMLRMVRWGQAAPPQWVQGLNHRTGGPGKGWTILLRSTPS